jgi:RIO kinase 1
MTDSDELDLRVERLRARHAARKHNPPAALAALEPSPVDTFAASVAVTKAERAWIREHLGPLHQRQLISDVLRRIQAGKEATVYACSAGPAATDAVIAAKLYRAKSMRGERNVEHYQQGRDVLDADGRAIRPRGWRLQKAIAQKSRAGREATQSSWLLHERNILVALAARGADVPRPIEHGSFALLMEFIGDGIEPAPTLSQVSLTPSEARPLCQRVLYNVELLLELGWVHGDLSAFNLLYHRGRAVLIDFPQVVAARANPDARSFFERDLERLAQYFGRAGVPIDARRLAERLWSKHVGAEALP